MERAKKKAQTDQLRDYLEVEIRGDVLDMGSFNRVYATNDDTRVLRVLGDKNEDSLVVFAARRANAFHQLFMAHAEEMGPSNLKIYTSVVKIDCELPGVKGLAPPYYVVEMERLNAMVFDQVATKQVKVNLFCLIWWLENAQSIGGFVHGDIKADNIMYREYKTMQNICFDGKFMLRNVSRVPVIFDLDFSRYHKTKQASIFPHATPLYGPPEFAIQKFGYHGNPDWWSIGFTSMFWILPRGMFRNIVYIEAADYISRCEKDLLARFDPNGWDGVAFDPEMIRVNLVACILNFALNDDWMPPRLHFPEWYACCIQGKEDVIRQVLDRALVIEFKQALRTLGAPVLPILRRLLSWVPEQRIVRIDEFFKPSMEGGVICQQSYTHHRAGSPPKFESEYMKCTICERIAHQACGIGGCLTLYCSDGCAQQDWDAHKHH